MTIRADRRPTEITCGYSLPVILDDGRPLITVVVVLAAHPAAAAGTTGGADPWVLNQDGPVTLTGTLAARQAARV